jgi:hypothetical protein
MALPTPVNGQITDAVTQSSVQVLGQAPAMAMGTIYQALASAASLLFQNAVSAQQQATILAQAATNQGVIQIYTVSGMAGAVTAAKLSQSDVPDNMLALLTALRGAEPPAAR